MGLLLVLGAGAVMWWLREIPPGGAESKDRNVLAPANPAAPASALEMASLPAPKSGTESGAGANGTLADRTLFAYVEPADATELDRALPAPTEKIRYVRLNSALIAGKQSPFWAKAGTGRVEVPLPGGALLRVAITETISLGPDRFTSTGTIEGRPQSRAHFSYNAGFLHATIQDVELGGYTLRTATAELAQFYEVDDARVPACAAERAPRPVLDADARAELARREAARSAAPAGEPTGGMVPPAAASAGANVTVDVMFLHTQSVLPTLTGAARTAALQSLFDNAVAKTNGDFAASRIAARLRLVRVAEVGYNEAASSGTLVQSDALNALRLTRDGKMDEIHALRDQVGADLVCLVLQRADSTSSGLGYILETPGENTNPLFGLSVVEYSYVSGTDVVSHELGHNFGCAHDRENSRTSAGALSYGAYPYSFGYRFRGQNQFTYRTIMAYAPGSRVSYFSNPTVVAPAPIGVPVGVPIGEPGEAHNALTVDQGAFEVANYRLQTQAANATGTLINVATRAFSGVGEQQLIGGFIIQGTAPKRMLLRAAGPALALAPFGVPDVLADPRLTLFTTDTNPPRLIVANNDWGSPSVGAASAAEITAAAASTGAFPFAVGSRDAALLVTLAPGSYTANVEGADGGTGTALVEAYEVDRAGNRIFNLSTRGYADKGREMIGGFVVQAGAGPTKRILIRVQGPSLARFGLSAMDDPYMEIYNSAGALVFKNDDWSTGAGVTSGARDDFKPNVTYYNEQQIFATGFAPGNRREPCVMADLAPGSYTVVVQPFELLPDQPAKAGVAIVEVFEVVPK